MRALVVLLARETIVVRFMRASSGNSGGAAQTPGASADIMEEVFPPPFTFLLSQGALPLVEQ